MVLARFLEELWGEGAVVVGRQRDALVEDTAAMAALLRERREEDALGLAYRPPALAVEAAIWGATLLYRACQFLVFREAGPELITAHLEQPCPLRFAPARLAYSVDLSLRALPDLTWLACVRSEEDPLVLALRGLGARWPLSSVGMKALPRRAVPSFMDDPCLRQLYIDRILERGDATRLDDPGVGELVRAALGAHADLQPALAAAFNEESSPL